MKNRLYKGRSLIDFPDEYVVVDLETTGFSPECNEIIEIGAIRIIDDIVTDTFSTLIKPSKKVDDYIYELTGIKESELDSAPKLEEVLCEFNSFVEDDIMVGHNVNFDINFLYDYNMNIINKPFKNDFIDTMRLARHKIPNIPSYSLDNLCLYFEIGDRPSHRALADCEKTYDLYLNLKNNKKGNELSVSKFKKKKTYYNFEQVKLNEIIGHVEKNDPNNMIYNKVCVITGKLDRLSRKDAMQLIADIGGINGGSVTSKTNYLILGNNDYCKSIKEGKSSKQKKAELLKIKGQDIEIIPEDVFYEIIHL